MCGLFAVIPTIVVKDTLAIRLRFLVRSLGLENDSRGGHSWGLWSYDYEPTKGLGDISDSWKSVYEFTDKLWKPKKMGWLAGHTRYGTHGAKVVENSHPFQHNGFTLAHNGVVTVNIEDAEVQAHVVDSGQLCIAISKFGLEEAIGATSGSIGLLFNDTENRIFAYRSNQVLHIAKCSWGYVISSDKKHLRNALEFAGFFDYELEALPESTVSAPWYPDFEPYEVKAKVNSWGGNKDWTSYRSEYSGYAGSYTGKILPHTPALPGLISDADIKAKWGISESRPLPDAPPIHTDLDAELREVVPVKSIHGLHGAMHFWPNKIGIVREFNINGPCDYCGNCLDEQGGFFFDQELPDDPLEFCSECLDFFEQDGVPNNRKVTPVTASLRDCN